MTFPPSLLRVRIRTRRRRIGLWLPLILLWLPALVVAILASPFVLVTACPTGVRSAHCRLRVANASALPCGAARGTTSPRNSPS